MINSSPEDFKRFMEGSIYGDYIIELDMRTAETVGLLEDPDGIYSGRDYDRFRGRLKNLREMKDIFIGMMENKANDLEEESNDS